MESLGAIGGEVWFRLGDRDLAMHIERTHQLRSGVSLTEFTASMAKRLGIAAAIVPMSDDPVSTIVHTNEGPLPFQEYFVRRRCEPAGASASSCLRGAAARDPGPLTGRS